MPKHSCKHFKGLQERHNYIYSDTQKGLSQELAVEPRL